MVKALIEAWRARDYLYVFAGSDWHALLNKLGPERFEQNASKIDVRIAEFVCRCVPDPGLSADGTAMLPRMTEWALKKFGDNEDCYDAFCMGRSQGRVRNGFGWTESEAIKKLSAAYKSSQIVALKRWSSALLREHEDNVKRDRESYEEMRHG